MAASTSSRPNIIFIITDQQRYDTIGALGYPHVDTPHLDRLVREGTHFTGCYVTGASCAPSRASLFTGYYPHTTGILRNGDLWRHSWIEPLAAAGYHCVNIGKMHTWPMNTPCGFHERYNVENKDRFMEARYYFDEWDRALAAHGLVKQQRSLYRLRPDYRERLGAFEWELPEELHSDMFVGNMAAWWVNAYPRTEPLFLQVGFPGPHPPYDPTPRFAAPYLQKDLPIDEVEEADVASQPPPFQEMRRHNVEVDHDSLVFQLHPSREARFRQRAYYLANMTMIDLKIGQLLEALRAKGYLDNALVVFTSDHGDALGDHGQSQKWTMYEQIVRAPLVLWSPGRVPSGRRVDAMVQQMDIAPCLLELAGAAVPASLEAQSLAPALGDGPFQGRDLVFCEQARDTNFTGADYMTMVRSRDWKLVHFLGQSCGQLIDLCNDPGETRNLWDDPRAASAKRELLDALRDWRIASQFHTKDWLKEHR